MRCDKQYDPHELFITLCAPTPALCNYQTVSFSINQVLDGQYVCACVRRARGFSVNQFHNFRPIHRWFKRALEIEGELAALHEAAEKVSFAWAVHGPVGAVMCMASVGPLGQFCAWHQ